MIAQIGETDVKRLFPQIPSGVEIAVADRANDMMGMGLGDDDPDCMIGMAAYTEILHRQSMYFNLVGGGRKVTDSIEMVSPVVIGIMREWQKKAKKAK